MKRVSLLAVSLFFLFSHSGTGIAQVLYPGYAEIIGAQEIVFDYSTDSCEIEDIPDVPARVFRDVQGNLQLIASHRTNYRMIGADFNSLTRDCANGPIMESDYDEDPAHYNSQEWIVAPYTLDGETIYAVIHNEYKPMGDQYWFYAWYNSLTFATSADTGKSYTHATPPEHLLATIPYQYEPGHPMGIFGGSNIIYNPNDGYYYMLVHLEQHELQDWGVGVLRTQTLDDPDSWRGWDGEGFNVTFVDPYNDTGFDPADHILAPVPRDNIGKMSSSLTYNTYFERFMVVGVHNKWNPVENRQVYGFYYALSEDLIHWSSPVLIMETPQGWSEGGDYYPSIIDHDDTTRNFEQTDQEAYLYYTHWNSGSYDRDLVRVPVRFHKRMVSQFTVTSTTDWDDMNVGDGLPFTGHYDDSGDSIFTLRSVLQEVNASPDTNFVFQVNFNIPGDGPHIIYPGMFLPEIEVPVIIDGYTQPGASENTLSFEDGNNAIIKVAIDGSGTGGATGLALYTDNSTIKGLAIYNFGNAIEIANGNNNTIHGNFLGLDASGSAVGDPMGITITSSSDNLIGGTSPDAQNILTGGISITGGDSYGNIIKYNYIGTDVTGASAAGSGMVSIGNGAHDNVIGGADGRNLLSGTYRGVEIYGSGTSGNQVLNNYIGTDKTGSTGLLAGLTGVQIFDGATDNIIGTSGLGNVIAGWTSTAVIIEGSGTSGNIFQGNLIGISADGLSSPGNQTHAIEILDNAYNNEIGGINQGEGNVIASNGGTAIRLGENAGAGNAVLRNQIFDNQFGIDLYPWGVSENDQDDSDSGPNNLQNFPEISFAYADNDTVTIRGSLQSAPNTSYRIEFFASVEKDPTGYGQGERFIGTTDVITDDIGQASFEVSLPDTVSGGSYITGTATDPNNNTSEFSAAMVVQSPTQYADIQISPDSFSFTLDPDITVTQTIDIQNNGTVELIWNAVNDADWLVNHPDEGTIPAGGSGYTNFDVNTTGMAAGDYTGTISIYSNDPDEPVVTTTVQLTVNETVGFSVSPEQFNVTVPIGEVYIDSLIIENTGNSQLSWSISADVNWLSTQPESGNTPVSESSGVEVQFDATGLTAGDYSGTLTVTSDGGAGQSITIPVTMTVSAQPDISVIPDTFHVTVQQGIYKTIFFTIRNDGISDLNCTVANDFQSSWLNPDPRNPDPIAPGDSIEIDVTINGTVLNIGEQEGSVFITSNDPDEPEVIIPITVTVLSSDAFPEITITFPGEGAILDTNNILAEFSVANFIVGNPVSGNDGFINWTLDENPPEVLYEVTPIALENLAEGAHELKVWLIDNHNQPFEPDISAQVNFSVDYLKPQIAISPAEIWITLYSGETGDTLLSVLNTGMDTLFWEITSAPEWISLSAINGELQPDDTTFIEVSFNTDTLLPGQYADDLVFQSNDPVSEVAIIPVTLTVLAPQGLEELSGIPDEFALRQNFPNPFNPETNIRFDLPAEAFVRISVYDVLGREVAVLVNDRVPAGYHSLMWDGRNRDGAQAHSGIYIYRITAVSDNGEHFTSFRKLILLK